MISSLKRLVEQGKIKGDEVTVAFVTGNGLKTPEVVEDIVKPIYTEATYESIVDSLAAAAA